MGYALKIHWKKLLHFSNGCQIAKNCIIFKNLTIFGILRFFLIWIRCKWIRNRRFWAILSDFCQKYGPKFLQFFGNRLGDVQNRRFWILPQQIQNGEYLRIPKMFKFLKMVHFLAIWQPFEKWTIFFNGFLKHNPYESRDSVYFRKSAKKSTISNKNP